MLLALFYLVVKRTAIGRALRGAAQNRVGIQTAGIDVLRLDMIAFGVGVALAAAAGALLAPDFLVYPENGAISTFKGFEIIVIMVIIGGLRTFWGPVVGAIFVEVLSEALRPWGETRMVLFALLVILVARAYPAGLEGFARTVARRLTARR